MSSPSTELVKSALSALHYSGAGSMLAPWTRGLGAILMLHQVNPDPVLAFEPNHILRITPEFLEATLRGCIEAGFDFVPLDEMRSRLVDPEIRSSRRFLSVTLDDAYRDNLTYAAPVFRRYGVPYTIYAPTDYIDGHGELWWLALEHVLRARSSIDVTIRERRYNLRLKEDVQRDRAFNRIYWHLRRIPETEARAIVRKLCAETGVDLPGLCPQLIMTWDELRQIAADPLATIGAHTRRHMALRHLSDDEARSEITGSVARLETELGKPCRHFAFPYGDTLAVSPRDVELCKELGLATTVTTCKGLIKPCHASELMHLPRLSLNGDYQEPHYVRVLLDGVPFAALDKAAGMRARLKPSGKKAA
jgi:peptidoglycan/xylan/chitin deacetylase (PgdA/CDA1 family)